MPKKGLIERLDEGVVIGDGGFVFGLEKRGYVKVGPWTPEATVEHPEAVRQLHREFLRAGSDVMQAFTFHASEDKLANKGNESSEKYTGLSINEAACRIAKEVAAEGDALVAGSVCKTPTYLNGEGKKNVQIQFQKQVDVFVANKLDFVIAEFFEYVEEMEWAIEVLKKTKMAVVAMMCIGPEGDWQGVPVGECAVRMVKAGADVVGLNCNFDPFMQLRAIKEMKKALKEANLKAHFITQPLGFLTPDAGIHGYTDLPEYPFALESRMCTRWDIQKYAREAYDLGVRYIGGCCGFESYHIRAIAEELSAERGGKLPAGSEKHKSWGEGMKMHYKPWVQARASREYWENLNPCSGRPYSSAMCGPQGWEIEEDPASKQTKK